MTFLFWFLFFASLIGGVFSVAFHSIRARDLKLGSANAFWLAGAIFFFLALSMGVVKRFGRPVREAPPGLHFIVPFIEYVQTVATQTRVITPSEDAASLDLQIVHTAVTLAYHVDPPYATFVLVNLNNETDFSFSAQFEQAIESKVTAQQQAEKADNDLKRIKIEAEQKIAQAQGEAEALRSQKQEITPELLQLRTIEMLRDKWDGRFPEVISGSLPMLDVLKAAGK